MGVLTYRVMGAVTHIGLGSTSKISMKILGSPLKPTWKFGVRSQNSSKSSVVSAYKVNYLFGSTSLKQESWVHYCHSRIGNECVCKLMLLRYWFACSSIVCYYPSSLRKSLLLLLFFLESKLRDWGYVLKRLRTYEERTCKNKEWTRTCEEWQTCTCVQMEITIESFKSLI